MRDDVEHGKSARQQTGQRGRVVADAGRERGVRERDTSTFVPRENRAR
jgi:hypothetical protein